jgi:periplasmic divalent cation tolerance protein
LILVQTTCGDRERARVLAGRLVEERLAACASVGAGVESVYCWNDAIQREAEVPLTFKTTRARFAALARRLRELHDYEVPELLATEVVEVDAAYAEWVRQWVGTDQSNQE